jgi:hypothetical protein
MNSQPKTSQQLEIPPIFLLALWSWNLGWLLLGIWYHHQENELW